MNLGYGGGLQSTDRQKSLTPISKEKSYSSKERNVSLNG